MKKSLSSISYVAKNFLRLLLMVLIPSACMALSRTQYQVTDFFINLATNIGNFKIDSFFLDVYRYFSIINFESWGHSIFWLVCMLVCLSGAGLVFSSVERHMRLGAGYSFKWKSLINDSIMMTLPYGALMIASYEVVAFIISGMVSLLYTFLGGTVLFLILSLILVIVVYLLFVAYFALLSLTLPSLLVDGYSFRFAASYSISLVQKEFWNVYSTLILPLIISYVSVGLIKGLCLILGFSSTTSIVINYIFSFIYYTFWMMYLPATCMKHYMHLTGALREDIHTSFNHWR